MSATQQVLAAGRPVLGNGRWRPAWRGHLQTSDLTWAIAFVVPYAAVFFAFAVYPIAYGLWMGRDPSLYAHVVSDPHYTRTVINASRQVAFIPERDSKCHDKMLRLWFLTMPPRCVRPRSPRRQNYNRLVFRRSRSPHGDG